MAELSEELKPPADELDDETDDELNDESAEELLLELEDVLALDDCPAAVCPPFRAISINDRISSLVRHWSSTQIFSLARKVPANTSPIPFAASARNPLTLAKILLNKLEEVVVAVSGESTATLRLSS